jgi:hypothetical protein
MYKLEALFYLFPSVVALNPDHMYLQVKNNKGSPMKGHGRKRRLGNEKEREAWVCSHSVPPFDIHSSMRQ